MLVVHKPKPTLGLQLGYKIARKDYINIEIKTPGSDSGSAFKPVHYSTKNTDTYRSPCDTTQDTTLTPSAAADDDEQSQNLGIWASGKSQFKQMKKNFPINLPISMSKMKPSEKIDLADLVVATICLVPRLGGGIDAGRRPFERARSSLLLHMLQNNEGWEVQVASSDNVKDRKALIAKFNTLLRNSIANEASSFVDKSQHVVKLAKDAHKELNINENGVRPSLARSEIGRRNLICIKFLTGQYRDVTSEERNDSQSLMVIASAFYALGKFEAALSVYQRAGIELKKKITSSSPEYMIRCAKLFNNMGVCYFELGMYEKAMKTFQRALELFHSDQDTDYAAWVAAIVDQASIMNNMAYTLIKFKEFEDASDLISSSFELQQILPENTSNEILMISTLSTMAYIYYRTKNYRLALDTYSACVQLQYKNTNYNGRDHIEVLTKMSGICKKVGDHKKRIYLLRTILVYQTECYLDEEIYETHAALAKAMQSFADAGGTSI